MPALDDAFGLVEGGVGNGAAIAATGVVAVGVVAVGGATGADNRVGAGSFSGVFHLTPNILWILMSMIFIVSACNAETSGIKFSGLIIPKEYVLQAPNNSSEGVYDDRKIPIALVIDEEDVKREIPEYKIAARGAQELSFVVYQEMLNIKEISDSVLSGFSDDQGKIGPDGHSQNRRYYRSADNWLLVSGTNGERLLVAQCGRTGIFGNVEGCDFKKNINGYGVSYHLEGSNLALFKEFEEFIAAKIESWKEQSQ